MTRDVLASSATPLNKNHVVAAAAGAANNNNNNNSVVARRKNSSEKNSSTVNNNNNNNNNNVNPSSSSRKYSSSGGGGAGVSCYGISLRWLVSEEFHKLLETTPCCFGCARLKYDFGSANCKSIVDVVLKPKTRKLKCSFAEFLMVNQKKQNSSQQQHSVNGGGGGATGVGDPQASPNSHPYHIYRPNSGSSRHQNEIVREMADWYVSYSYLLPVSCLLSALESTLLSSLPQNQDVFVYLDMLCGNPWVPKGRVHFMQDTPRRIRTIGRFVIVSDPVSYKAPSGNRSSNKNGNHLDNNTSTTKTGAGMRDVVGPNESGTVPTNKSSRLAQSMGFNEPSQSLSNVRNQQIYSKLTEKASTLVVDLGRSKFQGGGNAGGGVGGDHNNSQAVYTFPVMFAWGESWWEIYCASKAVKAYPKFVFDVAQSAEQRSELFASLCADPRSVVDSLLRVVEFQSEMGEVVSLQPLLELAKSHSGGITEINRSIADCLIQWMLGTAIVAVNNNDVRVLDEVGHENADAESSRLCLAISLLYEEQGKDGNAEVFTRRAVEEARRGFGNFHRQTAAALHGLAELLRRQGRHREAAVIYEEVVNIWKVTTGGKHRRVATCLNNYAFCLSIIGEEDKAIVSYKEAIDIWKLEEGHSYEEIATAKTNLANLNYEIHQLQDAITNYLDALQLREVELNQQGSEKVARLHRKLSRCYFALGDFQKMEIHEKLFIDYVDDRFGKESEEYKRMIQELSQWKKENASSSNTNPAIPSSNHISHENEASSTDNGTSSTVVTLT